MKEGAMDKKVFILLMVVVLGLGIFGCAGEKAMIKTAPSQILPVKVTVDSVERLNAIAAKPPYQATDVLVFRVNFKLSNPNNVLAKVDDLYFEAKVEDGTPEKTIVQAASMPSMLIPGRWRDRYGPPQTLFFMVESRTIHNPWSWWGRRNERCTRKNERNFGQIWGLIKENFSSMATSLTSLPDFPNLGTVRNQFKTEFAIPKL